MDSSCKIVLKISPTQERKGLSQCSSRFVSDHGLMICVRCKSEQAELFLSIYCCDCLAVSQNVMAQGSPGGENFVICDHSVFVGLLSDPTMWALGKGEGRVGGAELGVVGAAG